MDPPPAAYVAITPVETGKDSVPGVEGSRCEREPRLASCSVRAKLVARGRAPRPAHGLARGVLRRAGCAPAHAVLTSTHRTARCGPACLVVWEGKDRDRRSSPIPIVLSRAPHEGHMAAGSCWGRLRGRGLGEATRGLVGQINGELAEDTRAKSALRTALQAHRGKLGNVDPKALAA